MKTIVTRSVTLRPMATLHDQQTRAKAVQATQRDSRERNDAMRKLAHTGFVPQPPAPEMPAKLALHQEQLADPLLNHDFILGILTGALLMSSSMGILFGGKP